MLIVEDSSVIFTIYGFLNLHPRDGQRASVSEFCPRQNARAAAGIRTRNLGLEQQNSVRAWRAFGVVTSAELCFPCALRVPTLVSRCRGKKGATQNAIGQSPLLLGRSVSKLYGMNALRTLVLWLRAYVSAREPNESGKQTTHKR